MEQEQIGPTEFDGIFEDELEEVYRVPPEEALFDLEEALQETPPQETERPLQKPPEQPDTQEFEELCRAAGIDPQILGELMQEGYFEQMLKAARRESEARMVRSLGEDTPERRRYEQRLKNGFTSSAAIQLARQEQLEQKVRQLEQQLQNKERAIGSLQSRANPSWDFE